MGGSEYGNIANKMELTPHRPKILSKHPCFYQNLVFKRVRE